MWQTDGTGRLSSSTALDSGLSHMVCFGYWDISNQDVSRGMKITYTLRLDFTLAPPPLP